MHKEGLVKPRPATAKLRRFLEGQNYPVKADTLVKEAYTSAHRAQAVSSICDVVLYDRPDGSVGCGQVWCHMAMFARNLTLVQVLDRVSFDPRTSTAIWGETSRHEIILTEDIRDPVIFDRFRDNQIRTIVPFDVHI